VYRHELDEEKKTLKLWVRRKPVHRGFQCSGSGRRLHRAQDVRERVIRDLTWSVYRATVVVEVHRLRCPEWSSTKAGSLRKQPTGAPGDCAVGQHLRKLPGGIRRRSLAKRREERPSVGCSDGRETVGCTSGGPSQAVSEPQPLWPGSSRPARSRRGGQDVFHELESQRAKAVPKLTNIPGQHSSRNTWKVSRAPTSFFVRGWFTG
jgi:hypothetical protein